MTFEMVGFPGLSWEPQRMEDEELWFRAVLTDLPPGSLMPEGSLAVVTAEGKKLLNNRKFMLKRLLVFKRASDTHAQKPHVRRFISGQGNSAVYALGTSGIAIKEAGGYQSIHSAVERMDSLYRAIEAAKDAKLIPSWIRMPKHYGYVVPPPEARNPRQFLMMEQIDDGVTVEDILSIPDRGEEERALIQQRIGYAITDADIEAIREQWNELRGHLETAVAFDNAQKPSEYQRTFKQRVPDFHEGNVLVEKSNAPLDGRRFQFWIIDQ